MANTDDKRASILERIRRMKEMTARSTTNPNEAAIAAAKIQDLIFKYNIEQFELDAAAASYDSKRKVAFTEGRIDVDNPSIDWEFTLLGTIAKVNFARVFLFNHTPSGRSSTGDAPYYKLVGQPHHIEVAAFMFDYLRSEVIFMAELDEVVREARLKASGIKRWLAADRRAYVKSFKIGCSDILRERLESQFFDLTARSSSTALIEFNDKALTEYIDSRWRIGKPMKLKSASDANGYAAGRRRGEQIDINRRGVTDAERPSHNVSSEGASWRISERSSI